MKQLISSLLLLILSSIFPVIKAQNVDTLSNQKSFAYCWGKHFISDSKNLVISPLKWNSNQIIKFSTVAASTGVLMLYIDKPYQKFITNNHTKLLDDVSLFLEPAGNFYSYGAILLFGTYGVIKKDNKAAQTAMIATESLVLASLITRAMKIGFGRSRPDNQIVPNPHVFESIKGGSSFPSGHTTAAFSVASVISYQYRNKPWVGITSYALASLGGLSRTYDNRHWASDVFFGAILGTATGIFLCKSYEKYPFVIFPVITKNQTSLSLSLKIR